MIDYTLTEEQKAIGWAAEKMCEDHLYWLVLADRWLIAENFDKGPAHFFDSVPAPIRPLVRAMVRRKVRGAAREQGLYRHSPEERRELGRRGVGALSALIGDKPFLFGDKPHGADATLGAFLLGALCPLFDSPIRKEAERLPNLPAYADRIRTAYFA